MISQNDSTTENVAIEVKVNLPSSARPHPEAANFFQMAHVGPDIQLLIGYVDPQSVASKIEKARAAGKPLSISMEVELSHRLLVSPQGFATLKATVDQMARTIPNTEKAK